MKWKLLKKVTKQTNNHSKQTEHSEITERNIRRLFENCSDIQFHKLQFQQHRCLLLCCVSMVDLVFLNEQVIPTLDQFIQENGIASLAQQSKMEKLHLQNVKLLFTKEELITAIFSGYGIFYFKDSQLLVAIDIAEKPNRQPEDSNMEMTIKGPRDNLIEDISVNMALIRKRLPTNSLRSEETIVGKRSKTKVKVVYLDDVADQEILTELKQRIDAIDVDAIYSGQQLMQFIQGRITLFPKHDYSARPDWIVRSLLSGRIIVLIDNIPYALILPANFLLLLKSPEDLEYPTLYSSFGRVIRLMSILMATFLPGFWVAITAFHPNQMPISLLATVVESRKGIPLPTALEAIVTLTLFELFREAGLRLPVTIGQTLSVVGGLIIGDAAIRAGLSSPSMLVVIAASFVATFTLVNQSLVAVVSLVRLFVLIVSSFFGFFGFFLICFYRYSLFGKN